MKDDVLYQRALPTTEDDECSKFMDTFLSCEKNSIEMSELMCDKEKQVYIGCVEKYKELHRERSYRMMQTTKSLYFNTGNIPLVVLKK
jgi:hypothetical protein